MEGVIHGGNFPRANRVNREHIPMAGNQGTCADFLAEAESLADGKIADNAEFLAVIVALVYGQDGMGRVVTSGGLNHQGMERRVTCMVDSVTSDGDAIANKLMLIAWILLNLRMGGRNRENGDARVDLEGLTSD